MHVPRPRATAPGPAAELIAVGLFVILVAGDVAIGGHLILTGGFVLVPLVAATAGRPRRTAAIGALAVAAALGTGLWDHYFGTTDHLARTALVVVGSAVAIWSALAARRVREARRRGALLAEAGMLLEGGLDARGALQRLADMLVPAAADWCTVRIVEDGVPRLVAVAHVERRKRELSMEVDGRVPVNPESLVGQVLQTGLPAFEPELQSAARIAGSHDDEFERQVGPLGLTSAIVAPLRARGATIGALALSMAESGRRLRAEDVPFVQALASRAAVAVDASSLYEQARTQERLYEAMLSAQSDVGEGFAILEDGVVRYCNAAAAQIFRRDVADLVGSARFLDLVADEHHETARRHLAAVAVGDATIEPLELELLRSDGDRVEVEVAARALDDDDDGRVIVLMREITSRKRAEREREHALARSSLLAEASVLLASELGSEASLAAVARLACEWIAPACEIAYADLTGRIRRIAPTPEDEKEAAALAAVMGEEIDPQGDHPFAHVIRTGVPLVLDASSEGFAPMTTGAAHAGVIDRLGLRSARILPLLGHGRCVGALVLGFRETAAEQPAGASELAEELAGRIGLAVENARLYEERAEVARTLQASLLPADLPAIPDLDAAARYVPAAGISDVGGDFYDLLMVGPGRAVALIGDVCGKGTQAAALTALARHTLRAAALRGETPRAALLLLNEAILASRTPDRFCTAVMASLAMRPDGIAVTVCVGGHPLPLVRRGDGTVEQLGRPGTLIGIFEHPDLHEREALLAPGDALVLVTDGVIERPTADGGQLGPEGLAAQLAGASGGAGALAAAAAGGDQARGRDDVAVLVLASPLGLGRDAADPGPAIASV